MSYISKKSISKRLVWPVLVLLIAGLIATFLFSRNGNKAPVIVPSTSPANQSNGFSGSSPRTKGPSSSSQTSNSTSGSDASSDKSNTSSATSGSLTLTAAQTFVSNHSPGQNGSGTAEQSVCNTTPGATCFIEFTNGDAKKQLEVKPADSNGSVIWNWDITSSGLSSGSWKVRAVASLGGQTKTVDDERQLVVP